MSFEGTVQNGVVVLDAGEPLPDGTRVEVNVILPGHSAPPHVSMLEFLKSLPPGPLLFKTPAEANRFLQEERDSWER
jgi:hypothetical protein